MITDSVVTGSVATESMILMGAMNRKQWERLRLRSNCFRFIVPRGEAFQIEKWGR